MLSLQQRDDAILCGSSIFSSCYRRFDPLKLNLWLERTLKWRKKLKISFLMENLEISKKAQTKNLQIFRRNTYPQLIG